MTFLNSIKYFLSCIVTEISTQVTWWLDKISLGPLNRKPPAFAKGLCVDHIVTHLPHSARQLTALFISWFHKTSIHQSWKLRTFSGLSIHTALGTCTLWHMHVDIQFPSFSYQAFWLACCLLCDPLPQTATMFNSFPCLSSANIPRERLYMSSESGQVKTALGGGSSRSSDDRSLGMGVWGSPFCPLHWLPGYQFSRPAAELRCGME